MTPRSPALVRTERALGYINGSRQAILYAEGVDVLAVLDLIARLHPFEKNTAYGQGYIAGIVALWCGVDLFPPPPGGWGTTTRLKPYANAFKLATYYG